MHVCVYICTTWHCAWQSSRLSSLNRIPSAVLPPPPAPSHRGARLGTAGHAVAFEPYITAAGYHGRGAGRPPPPGDELRSNKPRSSQQEGFMPTINQETQTAPFPAGLAESEAERGTWGS